MKNPPLKSPPVPAAWAWPASYRNRRHRLSRIVTGPDGESGDDVLEEWWRGEIYGVAVCGFDGQMFGGDTDLSCIPVCRKCLQLCRRCGDTAPAPAPEAALATATGHATATAGEGVSDV